MMSEANSSEVEKVLLFISDARSRAGKARERLVKDGAEPHIIDALDDAQAKLDDAHRRLMQGTYFAVPERSTQLAL